MAERPRPSPVPNVRPELDDEPKTDPRMLAAIEKHAPAPSRVRDLAVAIAAVGTSVVVALIFVDNRVQAQTDAGVKVHEARITAVEQGAKADRAQNEVRFERLEAGQLRTDKKLDALLDRLDVKNPAPTPKDGGQ